MRQAYEYSRELSRAVPNCYQGKLLHSPYLKDIEKELKGRIELNGRKTGATDDDIIKFKAQYQSNLYNQLSTVQGKGSSLASYYTLTKNANFLKKEIALYMSVTKADVMRVYTTYIKDKPAVILSCHSKR